MPLENHTIRKFRALKECPQGQQPGDVFEATEDAGNVLVHVGAAERVDDDADLLSRASTVADGQRAKPGSYNRRDMRVKE